MKNRKGENQRKSKGIKTELIHGRDKGIKKRSSFEKLLLKLNPQRNNYSSFLVFLAAGFLAGFSSAASMEALRSARAERSPRVVFSTFGRSRAGSSALAAFLAAFGAASLRSSHVRRCETRIRLASRLRISRHRV